MFIFLILTWFVSLARITESYVVLNILLESDPVVIVLNPLKGLMDSEVFP